MRHWLVALAGLVGLLTGTAQAAAPLLDPATCQPKTLATDDNDIRIDRDDRAPGKPVDLPAAVGQVLDRAATKLISEIDPDLTKHLDCKTLFFAPVYRLVAPEQRNLYVADVYIGLGIEFFYLIVHDPVSGKVTQDPPRIFAKWTQSFGAKDGLMVPPFVSAMDLFQDGHREIVFEERVHNGTLYNAVVYHYFRVDPQLALKQVLAVETNVVPIEAPPAADALLVREVTRLTPTRLRLSLLGIPQSPVQHARPLGYAVLEAPAAGQPFHVTERHAGKELPADVLVTCSEPADGSDFRAADDTFLREGYTLYY